jgi:hypothetical protein
VPSGRHNRWLFLVAAILAAGAQAAVPGNAQGQDPPTSFVGARVRLALRARPDQWLVGTLVGQYGDSLRLDGRESHAMLAAIRAALLMGFNGRSSCLGMWWGADSSWFVWRWVRAA